MKKTTLESLVKHGKKVFDNPKYGNAPIRSDCRLDRIYATMRASEILLHQMKIEKDKNQ